MAHITAPKGKSVRILLDLTCVFAIKDMKLLSMGLLATVGLVFGARLSSIHCFVPCRCE